MNYILIILHLFGFGAGVTTSVGNLVMMRLIQSSPGDAPVLGRVPPLLARVGQVGLALLWVTGLILVWTRWDGPENMPQAFWYKILCVVLLTGVVAFLDLTIRRVRNGDRAAAARLPLFGRIAAALLLLVVVFAVVAFN